MRQFEDRLRAELRRVDTAITVTKETMLARVARARRRRTVAAGVGAVAVCTLVLTVVVPMLGHALGVPDLTTGNPPRLIHEGRLLNVVFTDATHGYVLQERCTMLHPDSVTAPNPQATPDVQRECQAQLLVTADGGAGWQERALPAPPAHKDVGVDLLPGHSMMLWVSPPGAVAIGGSNHTFWTTIDGGLTWQESPAAYQLVGGYGVFGTADEHVFLAGKPPGVGEKNQVVAASDGSFWLRCDSGPCVRVTRDLGQSWQTLPLSQAGAGADWVATADGQTVYAGVSDGTASTLVRSTDGGATWSPVPGVTMAFRAWAALAMPNGDLIVGRAGKTGGLFRLTAGATAFEAMPGAPLFANALYRTGGWLVAATAFDQRETPDLGNLAFISADNGTTWIPVPQP